MDPNGIFPFARMTGEAAMQPAEGQRAGLSVPAQGSAPDPDVWPMTNDEFTVSEPRKGKGPQLSQS